MHAIVHYMNTVVWEISVFNKYRMLSFVQENFHITPFCIKKFSRQTLEKLLYVLLEKSRARKRIRA